MVNKPHYDPKNCVVTVDGVKVERRDSDGEPVRVTFDPRSVRSRKDNRGKVRHG